MAIHQTSCGICDQIAIIQRGDHPGLIAELDTGFAVLGESQFFRGYCVFLCKTPATELHELPAATRTRYLEEMAQLAEAVSRVVRPHKLNYECLGNQVHHLHFHVFPRQLTDPEPLAPVWGQMPKEPAKYKLDPSRDGSLIVDLRRELMAVRGAK